MKKISYILILTLILSGCANRNSKTADDPRLTNALRSEKNGWIIIHLEGSPENMGFQHGYLLANEILDLKGALDANYSVITGRNWDFYRNASYRLFWSKIPEEYRRELQGIANGVNAKTNTASIDLKDVIAMNSFLETTGYYVPWLDNVLTNKPPEHCSAIAATGSWTKDGKIVIAHNNWSEYLIGERWNIILDLVPENGNRIVMDALPGFIHSGDDFNINSAGLLVTETTISGFNGFDTTGIAEFVRARKAVQYASTIDEWINIMKTGNNGGYANDWLIGDNKTGEIARLELGLKNQFVEKTKDGCFIGSNFPVHERLTLEETSFDPASPDESANMRRKRWEQLMSEYKGKIDIEAAKSFMGDHMDVRRNEIYAGRFSLCGHMDKDSVGKTGIGWSSAYFAAGAVTGKATDGNLASNLQFWAIAGHPCGEPFIAKDFLTTHPEYNFQKDFLRDMPSQKWLLTEPVK